MQAPPGSVTRCIQQLKAGKSDDFQKIWDHYFEELLEVARGVLRQRKRFRERPPVGAGADGADFLRDRSRRGSGRARAGRDAGGRTRWAR